MILFSIAFTVYKYTQYTFHLPYIGHSIKISLIFEAIAEPHKKDDRTIINLSKILSVESMPHSTLAENVAAALRESIYNGGHFIGERLIELTLAHEMNVSQNTVRDALRILEQEGLVVKHARKGVYVRTYTAVEAEELYALWAVLEKLALNWTITALTEDSLQELRDLVDEARSQTEARNPLGAIESLLTFHETVGRVAGKPQTAALLTSVLNQVRLLENGIRQVRAPRTIQQRRAQIADYELLLNAIERRDLESAHSILLKTITADCNALLDTL